MTMTENILAVYDAASESDITEGTYWYREANALAWTLDHAMPIRGAAVIAALSPRLRWDKNALYARIAYSLKGYDITPETLSYIPTLNNSRVKALKIVNGAHPRDVMGKGLKTNAFLDNILNPFTSEAVTVDKHAADIARGMRTGYSSVVKDKDYRIIAQAYRDAAHYAGVAPLTMQAITWVAWRNGVRGNAS